MDHYSVGDTATLLIPCMGLPIGSVGVCYESYDLGEPGGASFIFPNGEHDGFSPGDQRRFLNRCGHCAPLSSYQFQNVMKLSRDFTAGIFNAAFKA